MTIPVGALLEFSLEMLYDNQQIMNVWQYEVLASPSLFEADAYAEAWWNHVKDDYRALVVSGAGRNFNVVRVRELNEPTGALAEFAIPEAEEDGTRSAGALGSFLAGFAAVGVRLSVGSRVTRPGQKRIPWLTEGDVAGPLVGAGFVTLVEALMETMTTGFILGSPAEFVELDPIVVRKDNTGTVTAHQPITGYVVNSILTTQVSRRVGRGS